MKMKQYKEQINMIETLFREKIKVNEAVEIRFDSISILALKTKNGYEVTVYDNQTNIMKPTRRQGRKSNRFMCGNGH